MAFSQVRVFLVVVFCFSIGNVLGTPKALSVTPSSEWYGNDGTWSAVSLRVGTPQQWIDVLASTASSETWVVSPGGCDGTNKCTDERGGLFNLTESSTWKNEGFYLLGLDTHLGFNGSGDYGLDTLEFGDTGISLSHSIIGSINTTEYLTGFLGLGIVPGNFTDGQFKSPIGALVENENLIPSHSYGFTAGATYQQKGEPCSLTLGGYDANRFVPHNVTFGLNPIQQPEAFLNSISVSSSTTQENWFSTSFQILAPADGVYTIIDSSTPFIWLPKSICDQFQEALGLTYNQTLQLYTFDANSSLHDDLRTWNLTFTFSLSDSSRPSDVVNITLPYAAFDLQLTYPYIPNTNYSSPDATKYYFPLRRATDENQYTLGRSFLQEVYIITDYERNNFSVHQAIHTSDPIGNTSIVDIVSPLYSELTGPSATSKTNSVSKHLSKAALIGIAVGATAVVILLFVLSILYCRCRRRQNDPSPRDGEVDASRNRFSRIAFMNRFSRLHEAGGTPIFASEMDHASIQRFELPNSQAPAELYSEPSTHVGANEPNESANLTAYERARLKNEVLAEREKSERDVSAEPHYRAHSDSPFPSPAWSMGETGSTIAMNNSPVSSAPPTYSLHSVPRSGYSGPIPGFIQEPKLVVPNEGTMTAESNTMDSLGSGFTEEEGLSIGISEILDLWGGRREGRQGTVAPREVREGLEMVHVPVVAEQRFSWEGPEGDSGTVIKGSMARYF